MRELAIFLVGMAAGIVWYRAMIIRLLGRYIHTACDYCQFRIKKEELFPKKRK